MNQEIQDKLTKLHQSPWTFFIRKRPIAWLLTVAIITFGIMSVLNLPQEIQPEINIPFGAVSTVLPGANPEDIESLITDPLEKKIASVSDIKTLSSTSNFGSSIISIEFEADVDLDKALQNVKDAVDLAKNELPDDATDPLVIKAEANDFPIIDFSLTSDRPLYELTNLAEDIQDELEKINGVSRVDVIGGQQKEVQVILDPLKINAYGLNIQDVTNIIKFGNNNIPIGIISTDKLNYSVRIDNRYQNLTDLRNLPLLTLEGTTIYLKDIAIIGENYPTESQFTKLSINGKPSKKTITLRVNKKEGGNLIAIADATKLKIDELHKTIASDVEIGVSGDNSQFIRQDLGILIENGQLTTILIIIILFLALGLKEGLIAGLSIPLTFLIALTVMYLMGMTINSLSLFSLVIALGLLVDTAIIMMEGIHENMKNGLNASDSAMLSVDTYKWPLIAGTMTTIFAFFPMLLVSGILGEFLKTLPITISAALFASLFVSLTIGPSISGKFLKLKAHKKNSSLLEPIFNILRKFFYKIIQVIIKRKIFRITTILIAIIAFAGSISLPATGKLVSELFPKTDVHYFIIDVELPKGVTLDHTEKTVTELETLLYDIPEIDNFLSIIGTGQAQAATDILTVTGASSSSHLANITANLVPKEEREKRSYEITKELRKKFQKFTDAKITIREISEGPPTEAPITLRITGDSLKKLKEISTNIEAIIKNVPNTQNVQNSFQQGLNEFKFTLDRNKLSFHGLNDIQVSGLIRNIVQGMEATQITINGDDLNVIVRYEFKNNKISISDIENFSIQSPKGYSVNLSQLGKYEFDESLASIDHEDQKKIVKITSDITKNGNVVTITDQVQQKLEKMDLPSGYEIKFGGDLEQINESFQELYVSMAVGIILIAFTLVLMFNSFKQPLIIILTLPLALIGVFPGLMTVGLNLSFPAFLGVVALAGVVVNDAIVLIDRINNNRKNGIEFKESIAEASHARLQPIIMTSITTVVGILPLAISNEFWAGLGFALIFGLATATLLTLIVIPVLYYMFEWRQEKKRLKQLQQT